MQDRIEAQRQYAKHLAARAVVAYRANFPIDFLSISDEGTPKSGIFCDWKQLRASYRNDQTLLCRGFAFVYIGQIIDQEGGELTSDALQKELVSDLESAAEARETAVQWRLADAVSDTDSFAHGGYKLASRLLRRDRALIDALADELCAKGAMNKDQLLSWLDSHTTPLALDELESSWTF